ncbi:hypothetical protein GQ457_15G029330 [Hibiscus cannabinus]
MANSIASRWRKLSGEKNWEGLLQPLDHDLRKYLIHYAQRTGAVGDLFNSETDEPDASKEDFFSKACLVKGNLYKYEVTHFIYAGSKEVGSSWFGYVAVATDEGKRALGRRDILVSWRGTSSTSEWINDLKFMKQRSVSDLFPTAKQHGATVHRGFYDLYTGTRPDSTRSKTSAREQVKNAVRELVKKYKDEEISITITGFSLGAALATLTAMDIVANGYNKSTVGRNSDKSFMVTAITFGGPRVGNTGLKCVFDALGDHLHLLRVKNNRDPVPTLPPSYTELGTELMVDTYNSKYLKWKGPLSSSAPNFPVKHEGEDQLNRIGGLDKDRDEYEPKPKSVRSDTSVADYVSSHNMDVYAHGVAIKDIGEKTPVDKLEYNITLVNKHLDRVKNEYKIPPNWWTEEKEREMGDSIARRWRELSGRRNWEYLLQPLDPDLRRYIIHYGQMAGAVVDLFNGRTRRRNASEEDFFSKACLVKGNRYEYKVCRFIYAGSQSVDSAWIGYVAVATDQGKRFLGRRDILIAWRGAATRSEWINNARVLPLATASDLFPDQTDVKVHRGFHSLYTGTTPDNTTNSTSARKQVLDAVEELVKMYKNEEISITVTGFRLGAALATLTAMDIVSHGFNKPPNGEPFMVTAFTFGGPRVGNRGLARVFDKLGPRNLRLLRIRNKNDFIPDNPRLWYTDVGKELTVNTSASKYLDQMRFLYDSFSGIVGYQILLLVYFELSLFMIWKCLWIPLIGLIMILIWDKRNIARDEDGYDRDPMSFQDIGEDQDGCDLLTIDGDGDGCVKPQYGIPSYWWVGENRIRMVQRYDGRWRRRDV